MTEQTTESFHITSFVVRCMPLRLQEVMDQVAAMAGAEIHGSDPSGKFVALLDLDSEKELVNTITSIELIKGVINTSMVYHHAE
ncbi:MAG: chaperone NapD [Halioglobus sp.]